MNFKKNTWFNYGLPYNDVSRYIQMLFTLLALCEGIQPVTMGHPDQAVEQTAGLPVIWDVIICMLHHCNVMFSTET